MKRTILVGAVILVAGLALLGCDGDPDSVDTTATLPPSTSTAPTVATTQVAVATTSTQPADPDAACIGCHTDADTLMLLAVEAETGESLSTGEG